MTQIKSWYKSHHLVLNFLGKFEITIYGEWYTKFEIKVALKAKVDLKPI